jgi:hypothetical protein
VTNNTTDYLLVSQDLTYELLVVVKCTCTIDNGELRQYHRVLEIMFTIYSAYLCPPRSLQGCSTTKLLYEYMLIY